MNKVSVVITTFNRLAYLQQTIDSVERQTNVEIEIIVVDDGSTDGTIEYLMKLKNQYGYKIILSQHKGPATNRMLGYRLVTGDLVVFMDDDDYYTRDDVFSTADELLNQRTDTSAVFFNALEFYESTQTAADTHSFKQLGFYNSHEMLSDFMTKLPKPLGTFPAVFSKSKLVAAGIEDMNALNDTQIYLRSFISGGVYYSSVVAGHYRMHAGSIGNNLDAGYILQNLEEKYRISTELPNDINRDAWLTKQLWVTIEHYAARSRTFNVKVLLSWLKKIPLNIRISLEARMVLTRIKYLAKRILLIHNNWGG